MPVLVCCLGGALTVSKSAKLNKRARGLEKVRYGLIRNYTTNCSGESRVRFVLTQQHGTHSASNLPTPTGTAERCKRASASSAAGWPDCTATTRHRRASASFNAHVRPLCSRSASPHLPVESGKRLQARARRHGRRPCGRLRPTPLPPHSSHSSFWVRAHEQPTQLNSPQRARSGVAAGTPTAPPPPEPAARAARRRRRARRRGRTARTRGTGRPCPRQDVPRYMCMRMCMCMLHCRVVARALQGHCTGTARALHGHCTGIARPLHGHGTASARAPAQASVRASQGHACAPVFE